jgi:hypothetical protein
MRTSAGVSNYIDEWYNDVTASGVGIPAAAGRLSVPAGGSLSNVDFALAVGGAIAGTVTVAGGSPIEGLWVDVYDARTNWLKGSTTATNGAYRVQGLPTQDVYFARTADGTYNYVDEWFDNVPAIGVGVPAGAQPLTVPAGGDRTNVNFALDVGGWVEGLVSDEIGSPLVGIAVDLYQTNGAWAARATSDAVGWYEVAQVSPAWYYLRTDSGTQGFSDEWHNNVLVGGSQIPSTASAVPVRGGAATNIGFALAYRITEASLSNGHACIAWQAAAGTTNRVRFSTNIVAGVWTNAPDGSNALEQSRQIATSQDVLRYQTPFTGSTTRFYRVTIEY